MGASDGCITIVVTYQNQVVSKRDGIMEVYFNELCINTETVLRYEDIKRIGQLHILLNKYGVTTCRVGQSQLSTLLRKVEKVPGIQSHSRSFLFSFLREPYEANIPEAIQDDYLAHSWKCGDDICVGLALAHLMDSMAFSVADEKWNKSFIGINKDTKSIDVRNLFDDDTLHCHCAWLQSLKPVQPVECTTRPEDKPIKLRDDHGKNELLSFCERIVKSEYVVEIINSLPFKPKHRTFINSIKDDGIIEIVLPWTDNGLGIAVKTTGRNFRETEKIAKLLKEQYENR